MDLSDRKLLLIDTGSVAHIVAYNIRQCIEKLEKKGELEAANEDLGDLAGALARCAITQINGGRWAHSTDPIVIWCLDVRDKNNEYWRHSFLREKESVAYKDGRKKKSKDITGVFKLIYKYCPNKLGFASFEADDVAGLLCKLCVEPGLPKDVSLLTVDTDWMGLVTNSLEFNQYNEQSLTRKHYSPELNIAWHNTAYYKPVVRGGLADIQLWAAKHKTMSKGEKEAYSLLESPSGIWDIKHKFGDKSDNLPPGTTLDAISLLESPYLLPVDGHQAQIAKVFLDVVSKQFKIPEKNLAITANIMRKYGMKFTPLDFTF